MKRITRLWALLLVLAAVLCACGQNTDPAAEEVPPQETVAVQGITSLTLYDGTVTLRFLREAEDTWIWGDDPTFPLEQSAMAELLALPDAITTAEVVESPGELALYGLEDPQKYVSLTVGEEETTLYIGTQSTDQRWYALTPDGVVRLAPESVGTLLGRGIYAMAQVPQLPAIPEERLLTVTVTAGTEDASPLTIRARDGGRYRGSRDVTEATAPLASELAALTLSACVDYDPAEGAAAVCGLEPPAAVLHLTYLADTGAEKELTVTIGGETGDGGRYVTVNDDTTIYRMESASLTATLELAEKGL